MNKEMGDGRKRRRVEEDWEGRGRVLGGIDKRRGRGGLEQRNRREEDWKNRR